MAWRFSSPVFFDSEGKALPDGILSECPRGKVLREMPYLYEAIGAYGLVESSGLAVLSAPMWLQQALGIIGGEKSRAWEAKMAQEKASRHASIGARARSK